MAEEQQFYDMTQKGLDNLKVQLKDLVENQRPKIIKRVADARALGDLSENTEYSAAKEEQALLENKIRTIQTQIQYSRVINTGAEADSNTISLGKKVTLKFEDDDDVVTYQLVGSTEEDLEKGRLDIASAMGKAISGHKKGQTVTVEAPGGSYKVTIQKVEANENS